MIPRPRAEGGASDDRSAAASDGMTCSPIPMPCRSLSFARSLLLSDLQAGVAIAMCAVFVSSSSLIVSSFLVAAVALYVFVRSCVSDGVGSERCVVTEMRAVCHGVEMGLTWRWAI